MSPLEFNRVGGPQGPYPIPGDGDGNKPIGDGQTQIGPGQFAPLPIGGLVAAGVPLPKGDVLNMGDLMSMVMAIKQKVEQTQLDTSSSQVQGIKEQKAHTADERIKKLEESQQKAEDAKKGGLVGQIFGWIAAAAMTIAGAIMVATGVGAAAGIALLAGGITMMTMMVLQNEDLGKAMGLDGSLMNAMVSKLADALVDGGLISPEDRDKAKMVATAIITGIMTAVAVVAGTVAGGPFLGLALATQTLAPLFTPENLKAMGVPEDQLMAASIGITVGLAVAGIAAGAGGAKALSSAGEMSAKSATLLGGLGGRAAQAAAQAAKTAPEVAAQVSKIAAQIASYTALTVSALATIGQGASQVTSSVIAKEGEDIRAHTKELEAFMAKLQKMFDDQSDRINEILKRMQDSASAVMSIINQVGAVGDKIVRINAV